MPPACGVHPQDPSLLDFGKHKGRSYEYVYSHEPGYCRWAGWQKKGQPALKRFAAYCKEKDVLAGKPPPPVKAPLPPASDATKVTFGKHKGKTFREVWAHDQAYCRWARREPEPGVELQQLIQYCLAKEAGGLLPPLPVKTKARAKAKAKAPQHVDTVLQLDALAAALQMLSVSKAAPAKAAPPPSYLCPVCDELMTKPMLCSEGHSLCALCWTKWLARKPQCPMCRKAVSAASLVRNRALETLIDDYRTAQQIC
eukprot:TRINITY_DN3071_c0_g2_i3.p1 TRINITY_DN3071_c0_g2~~TRINITY_DN3071_c0_g2_i3.p1  ORF type:complete len:255 (+),score=55.84 TRINITY_DN3071_c0_g2_i3:524-1288(+)